MCCHWTSNLPTIELNPIRLQENISFPKFYNKSYSNLIYTYYYTGPVSPFVFPFKVSSSPSYFYLIFIRLLIKNFYWKLVMKVGPLFLIFSYKFFAFFFLLFDSIIFVILYLVIHLFTFTWFNWLGSVLLGLIKILMFFVCQYKW